MNKIPTYEGLQGNTHIPNVFNEIVDLDLRYAKYIQCNDSTINPDNKLKCSAADMDIETINKAYTKLMGDNTASFASFKEWVTANPGKSWKDYQTYLSNRGDLNNALNVKGMSNDEYKRKLHDIENKHKHIVNLRKELDMKNQELNNINNPVFTDNQMKYDASVYSGVLWTILASSLLYYLFNKL